jgi:hypothetical protein
MKLDSDFGRLRLDSRYKYWSEGLVKVRMDLECDKSNAYA